MTFQIGEARQGQLGDVIEATDGRIIPVSFSEGSTLLLHHRWADPGAVCQGGRSRVLVEDGVVDATIVHRKAAARDGSSKWALIT